MSDGGEPLTELDCGRARTRSRNFSFRRSPLCFHKTFSTLSVEKVGVSTEL